MDFCLGAEYFCLCAPVLLDKHQHCEERYDN
jgi:hypothetical protein